MNTLMSRTTPSHWTDGERLALFTAYVYTLAAVVGLALVFLLSEPATAAATVPESSVVATVPASTEDALSVDYSAGTWHFTSDTGDWTSVTDSWCRQSEDSCTVNYNNGQWTVTRNVP